MLLAVSFFAISVNAYHDRTYSYSNYGYAPSYYSPYYYPPIVYTPAYYDPYYDYYYGYPSQTMHSSVYPGYTYVSQPRGFTIAYDTYYDYYSDYSNFPNYTKNNSSSITVSYSKTTPSESISLSGSYRNY